MGPKEVLQKYFGYSSFRPVQEDIISAIGNGNDVVAIMPTGAGKSICFQVPSLLFPHGTVVISPLISLMKDQVEALSEQGVPASYVNSTVPYDESIERLRDLYRGKIKLLYMAPEKLEPSYFTECLTKVPLSMVVIDEAHCVSQWGHDFRPSYRRIKDFVDSLPQKPIVTAFTATATPLVERDMKESLGLMQAQIFRTGLDRPNLSFRVIRDQDKDDFILKYVEAHSEESGIIYCATRKSVDELYNRLTAKGIECGKYHAGLSDEERRQAQEEFSFDNIKIMVATNAFGMGIDKSNVRYVIHYQMPKSPEAYYQEAGRAGRDGADAECILLYSGADVGVQKYLIDQGTQPEEQKKQDFYRLNTMVDYSQTTSCLRNFMLAYFGEKVMSPCGHCSSCQNEKGKVDITDTAVLVFKTILSVEEKFGASLISQILKGSKNQEILKRDLQEVPTYGKLSFAKQKHLMSLLNSFVADGYLRREGEPYPILKLTEKASPVLSGLARVKGLALGAEEAVKAALVDNRGRGVRGTPLFEKLRQLRKKMAEEESVPPFVVFADTTLEDMVRKMPKTEEEMAEVHGVGAFKLQKYGLRFLQEIIEHSGETPKEDQAEVKVEPPKPKRAPNEAVRKKLISKRNEIAKEMGIPKSTVFTDSILEEMVNKRPTTVEELRKIKGIGPMKAASYGLLFIQTIQEVEEKL